MSSDSLNSSASRSSIISAILEIMRTQGAATVVLLMVIWIGREVGMQWVGSQVRMVDATVRLTESLASSLDDIVQYEIQTTQFQAEVQREHTVQTEALTKLAAAIDRLETKIEGGG